jgi:hypothetical protein
MGSVILGQYFAILIGPEVVGPSLHHVATLCKALGAIVCRPDFVAGYVRKLPLDYIGVVSEFIQ